MSEAIAGLAIFNASLFTLVLTILYLFSIVGVIFLIGFIVELIERKLDKNYKAKRGEK